MQCIVELGCVEFFLEKEIDENGRNRKFHESVSLKLQYLMGIHVYNIKEHVYGDCYL